MQITLETKPLSALETDALVSARLGINRGVNSDDFSPDIHERSARISRVDGRIGLEEL